MSVNHYIWIQVPVGIHYGEVWGVLWVLYPINSIKCDNEQHLRTVTSYIYIYSSDEYTITEKIGVAM